MDSLDSLPVDEKIKLNDMQKSVMEKYIGAPAGEKDNSTSKWKLVGYLTILFVLLSNSWTTSLFESAPYFGSSSIGVTALSMIVFAILSFIMLYFFV